MKIKYLFSLIAVGYMAVSCMNYEKRLKECDSVGDFKDGYALCLQDGKYFFIDRNGKMRSGKYDEADEFTNGYALARNVIDDDNYQFIILDKDCKEKHYPLFGTYGNVNPWGKLWVNATGSSYGWALLDVETGSLTQLLGYLDCVTDDWSAVVSRRRKGSAYPGYYEYAIYDGQGNEVIPFNKYSFIGNFSNGLAQYSTTGYFFFTGEHAFASSNYDKNKKSCSSLATSTNFPSPNIKLGYIDTKGAVIIPARFNTASAFNKAGYARVSEGYYDHDRRDYIIDRDGRNCTGDIIAEASMLSDGRWKSGKTKEGECILANNAGRTVSFGSGYDIANVGKYIMTRKGTEYKLYRMEGESEIPEQIGSFSRNKGDELVVLKDTWDKHYRTYTSDIRFFDQRVKRGYALPESPYDEYGLDGEFLVSGWDCLYDIYGNIRVATFKFQ